MKKIVLPFLCLLIMSIPTVAQMTAGQYNNAIIDEQEKIAKLMVQMAGGFGKNIKKSEKIRVKLVKQSQTSVQKTKQLPDYKGNTEFRDAAVAVYSFYAELSQNEFKEMVEILKKGSNITEADIKRLTVMEKEIEKRETPLDEAFEKAQKVFASEFNIVISGNKK